MKTAWFKRKIGRVEILKPLLKTARIFLATDALIPFWRIKAATANRTKKLN